MEKKYPVLKCDKKLWEEVKPVLESFGITDFHNADYFDKDYSHLVCNYGSDAVDEFKIGTTWYSKEGLEITDHRYLVDTKEEFLSAVAKLLGKEFHITSKNNKKDMERINIAEKLKHCKKGTKLYCTLYGEVEFECIDEDGDITFIVQDKDGDIYHQFVNLYGSYNSDFPNGECLLFPSKDNRNWNTFKVLEEGHRVMCSYGGNIWELFEYSFDKKVRGFPNNEELHEPTYIVPVEEFDFNAEDISVNIKKSIV